MKTNVITIWFTLNIFAVNAGDTIFNSPSEYTSLEYIVHAAKI